MNTINYLCFKLNRKTTRNIKNDKKNSIIFIGDKFFMSIR